MILLVAVFNGYLIVELIGLVNFSVVDQYLQVFLQTVWLCYQLNVWHA
ncbi:hypothetical protein C4K04_3817 [Pseudomonas chlororaphis]|uniref:Uncharacterized protein n=1 Tax=Pseudomonas chlororaphis TaxID=587753 RepID=A0A3G7TQV2_9PSED|nr:hypothetical protein C4K04_3817 [Pseudomonas chlororaphis]